MMPNMTDLLAGREPAPWDPNDDALATSAPARRRGNLLGRLARSTKRIFIANML